jgi:hypothetical protein
MPIEGEGMATAPVKTMLLGGGGITVIGGGGGCARPPGNVAGDGIGIDMVPPPFIMGVGIGTCPDAGLGGTMWTGIGVLLGVPRPPGPTGPTKGVEPACPGLGMDMGMPPPVGITTGP